MAGERFSVKIEGSAIPEGKVPFRLLANVLNGVQQTFYYIAMAEIQKEPRTRGRFPQEVIDSCELRRVAENPGSYELVAEIVAPIQGQLYPSLGGEALDKYINMVSLLEGSGEIDHLFPDGAHRRQILRSIDSYCPKEGDEWLLFFSKEGNGGSSGKLTKETRRKIARILTQPQIEARTVTGELQRLHLDEKKLGILYPPTERVLECFYDPEIEDFIIDNLKGLIQVTGRVQLDASGYPDKIIDVRQISQLDLSPVRLTVIESDNLKLILRKPISVQVEFEDQEIVLEFPDFNIFTSAPTREEAIREFEKDLTWLWEEYAKAEDDTLTSDAQALKRRILDLVEVVKNGSEEA